MVHVLPFNMWMVCRTRLIRGGWGWRVFFFVCFFLARPIIYVKTLNFLFYFVDISSLVFDLVAIHFRTTKLDCQ